MVLVQPRGPTVGSWEHYSIHIKIVGFGGSRGPSGYVKIAIENTTSK